MGGKTDTHTHIQTDRQTYRHINTLTRPGLRAGPSEKGVAIVGFSLLVNLARGLHVEEGLLLFNIIILFFRKYFLKSF